MNERLQNTIALLRQHDEEHQIIDLGGPAVRAKDVIAANNLDIDEENIVKTIMCKGKKAGIFSVAIRSKHRVSYHKLKALLKDKNITTLHPDEMRKLGWKPGECCPLSVQGPLYVDDDVMHLPRIHTGSGDLRYGIEFSPHAIGKLQDSVTIAEVRE